MQWYLLILFTLPFVSALLSVVSKSSAKLLTAATSAFLIAASTLLYFGYDAKIEFSLPALNIPFLVLDVLLLGYFSYVGFKAQNKKILFLALIQLALLIALEGYDTKSGFDIVVDRLSILMLLLINIVGSTILLYSLRYVNDETDSAAKRSQFLAILTAFLGVMNLLVSTDNGKWLFLFFELTTLASFLLIGFRDNEESKENARTALWMNQIGGVALILAVLVAKSQLHTVYISEIIEGGGEKVLFFAALVSIAALIKGAQIPFSPWLLGAMVAPTPVSAILHSSTMVKIAPYLLLKISPVISGTLTGYAVATLGALSFAISGAIALREDNFKKILAYSTISLLGLMVMTAAIGTPLSITACLLLVIFHGISKALLFMCAGVLEKRYHIKSIEKVDGLIERAPLLTTLIFIGFLSIALPPFGVFFAKWLVYEGVAGIEGALVALLLLFVAVGSVALTLLYFKTVGRFVARSGAQRESEDSLYLAPITALGVTLLLFALFVAPIIGAFFAQIANSIALAPLMMEADVFGIHTEFGSLSSWHILAAFFLLGIAPLLASKIKLKGVDKAKPYSCGERIETNAYSFYFAPAIGVEKLIRILCVLLFITTLLMGALNR